MSDQRQGRVPPQSVEVEEAILGSMLIESEAADIALMKLTPHDFYKPGNRMVFEAMLKLTSKNQPCDMLSLESYLRDHQQLDDVGGPGYLADLTRSVSSAANADYHCQIIKEKAIRRRLITNLNSIIGNCYDPSNDTYALLDEAQASVSGIVDAGDGHMRKLSETLDTVMKDIERIQEQGEPIGLRTGLDIDNLLQGFQGSKLYFIGARPSMGKTALVLTIMRRLARDNHSSGILSMETSHRALGYRLLAQASGVEVDCISSGKMKPQVMQKVIDAENELRDLGIYIDDEPALTAQKARSKCRLLVKKGVKIIFIDFLQLMQAEGRTKHEEIGIITKTLKQVSKELDIPIVVLSQLSRKVEDRNDKRPQLADLRESGSIEEDADCIMFLYRPEYYGITTTPEGKSTQGLANVIISKNKDGKTGLLKQRFVAEYMRFENFAWQHNQHPEPVKPHYAPE